MRKVFATIPMLDEEENIETFFQDLCSQSFTNFEVAICVNQPEAWRDNPLFASKVASNERSIAILQKKAERTSFPLFVIDKASKGNGWQRGHEGVGMARRSAMEMASQKASDEDIIVCMDPDTRYPQDFFSSIVDAFDKLPLAQAICIPYFHALTGNPDIDRAMLRYEIYMRYYALNLIRINSPYAYTPIGSSMACTAKAYRRIRGMAPRISGEDFYFIMQLRKTGVVIPWVNTSTQPSSRPSQRVIFGTGPAIIKGLAGHWSSYPIFDSPLFDLIKECYNAFDEAINNWPSFINTIFPGIDIEKMRKNNPKSHRLVHALHEKADALRILQFLKENSHLPHDEENLIYWDKNHAHIGIPDFNFSETPIEVLDNIRHKLKTLEEEQQQQYVLKLLNSHLKDSIWKYMK